MNELMNFKGKIGRMEFLWKSVVIKTIMILLIIGAVISIDAGGTLLGILLLLPTVVCIAALWSLSTKRTRSTGLNPWLVLVAMIPYVNFPFIVFLLLAPEGTVKGMDNG